MANIAKVLKDEITRISRKEIKAAVGDVARANTTLKRTIAALKKRITTLEKDTKRFTAVEKKPESHPQFATEETKRARLTSKGIRALRKKLKLPRPAFAKLVGTSAQTVYMWEKKEGALRLRPKTREALLSLRGVGVREVKKKLAGDQED